MIYLISKKYGLKKVRRKNYKNHLRSNNNYEICTAAAHCFPNILGAIMAIVLEHLYLSENKVGRPPPSPVIWISVTSRLYTLSAVYISTTR